MVAVLLIVDVTHLENKKKARDVKMEINLNDNLWQLFNEYSTNGVMIISHEDFKKEIERICIQSKGEGK